MKIFGYLPNSINAGGGVWRFRALEATIGNSAVPLPNPQGSSFQQLSYGNGSSDSSLQIKGFFQCGSGRNKGGAHYGIGRIIRDEVENAILAVKNVAEVFQDIWAGHLAEHKALVLEGAGFVKDKKKCVILGAGPCSDIPLLELAQIFEKIVLVDMNETSMQHAVSKLPDELRSKVEIKKCELIGNLFPILERIHAEIKNAGDQGKVQRALNRAIKTIDEAVIGRGEIANIGGDYIISDMILSQLTAPFMLVQQWLNTILQGQSISPIPVLQALSRLGEKIQRVHFDELMSKNGAVVMVSTDIAEVDSYESATSINECIRLNRMTITYPVLAKFVEVIKKAKSYKNWIWHRLDPNHDSIVTRYSYLPVYGIVFCPDDLK